MQSNKSKGDQFILQSFSPTKSAINCLIFTKKTKMFRNNTFFKILLLFSDNYSQIIASTGPIQSYF